MCYIKCSMVCCHENGEYIRDFHNESNQAAISSVLWVRKVFHPSSSVHEGHEPSPCCLLCLSGFSKDAAMKNFFNSPRDYSLCCKTRGMMTLGVMDGRCSAPAPCQCRCCCKQHAMKRSQARAHRGCLASARQLFGRSLIPADLPKTELSTVCNISFKNILSRG